MRVGKITLKSWANSINSKVTKYHPWNEYHCLRFFLDFLYIRKNTSRVEQFQQIERIKTIKHFCPSVLQRGELVLHLVFPNHFLDQTFPFFPFSFSSSFSSYKNRYCNDENWNQKCSLEKGSIPRDEEKSFQSQIISVHFSYEGAWNQQIFTITGNFQVLLPLSLIESIERSASRVRKFEFQSCGYGATINPSSKLTFTAITEISIPLRGSFHPLKDYRISKGLS